jgi:hypothetical protein
LQFILKNAMKENEEPRLFPPSEDEIIFQAVEMFNLPEYAKNYIQQILKGTRSESSLVCCHGGCEVCNDTILNCLEEVRRVRNLKDNAI